MTTKKKATKKGPPKKTTVQVRRRDNGDGTATVSMKASGGVDLRALVPAAAAGGRKRPPKTTTPLVFKKEPPPKLTEWHVSGRVLAGTHVGDYKAATGAEAIEMAKADAGVSLCHHCADKVSDPEVDRLVASAGDVTVEDPDDNDSADARRAQKLADDRWLHGAAVALAVAFRVRGIDSLSVLEEMGFDLEKLHQAGVEAYDFNAIAESGGMKARLKDDDNPEDILDFDARAGDEEEDLVDLSALNVDPAAKGKGDLDADGNPPDVHDPGTHAMPQKRVVRPPGQRGKPPAAPPAEAIVEAAPPPVEKQGPPRSDDVDRRTTCGRLIGNGVCLKPLGHLGQCRPGES